jgi:stage II sporulation protein P
MKNKTAVIFITMMLTVALALALMLTFLNTTVVALAEEPASYYTVYNDEEERLCVKTEDVEKGDFFVTEDNKKYEIVEVDDETKICKAVFVEDIEMLSVDIEKNPAITLQELEKRAGLYITHNAESYIPTDGTASIFGEGGIHDVANAFADALRQEGFIVELDETLHLPQDIAAYSRSRTTAQNIIQQFNPDVLFDLHRDGAPREIYDTEVDGVPMSKVRLVVGRDNPDFEQNYQFALEIKALADEWYPGLMLDIYMGGRDYNQDLMSQALLLEFGSQEVEKELALRSVVPFANVVNGVVRQRAGVASSSLNYDVVMVSTQNDTSNNSIIFSLLVVLGSVVILFFVLLFVNKRFNKAALSIFSQVRKGLFFTRRK